MPILHGMDLKCGKKCRSEFIGIMDALLFCILRSSGETGGTEQTVCQGIAFIISMKRPSDF
jgi:hypothetical protein